MSKRVPKSKRGHVDVSGGMRGVEEYQYQYQCRRSTDSRRKECTERATVQKYDGLVFHLILSHFGLNFKNELVDYSYIDKNVYVSTNLGNVVVIFDVVSQDIMLDSSRD